MTIYSIFPLPLTASRPFSPAGPDSPAVSPYKIEPSTQDKVTGEWSIERLDLQPSFEYVRLLSTDAAVKRQIPEQELANDLIRQWTQGHNRANFPELAGIGVWVGPSGMTDTEVKKTTEFKNARTAMLIWCAAMRDEGDRFWEDKAIRSQISESHIRAAVRLGEPRDWTGRRFQAAESCPMCAAIVRPGAAICTSCRYVLNREKYAELTGEAAATFAAGAGNATAPAVAQEDMTSEDKDAAQKSFEDALKAASGTEDKGKAKAK